MKVVVRRNKYTKEYEIWLVNGVQSFRFAYTGTRPECFWYRRMLRKALKNSSRRKR